VALQGSRVYPSGGDLQLSYFFNPSQSGVSGEEAVRSAIENAFLEDIFKNSEHVKINHSLPLMRTYKFIQEQKLNNWILLGIDTPTTKLFPLLHGNYTPIFLFIEGPFFYPAYQYSGKINGR